MMKWYVVRGYPLQELLDTTYAERVLLREAMIDYIESINAAAGGKEKIKDERMPAGIDLETLQDGGF